MTWGRRMLGGAETYAATVVAGLHERGYPVALWSDQDQPSDRNPIPLPAGVPEWCGARLGRVQALERLRAWQPDVLFVQVITDPELESQLLDVAPAVLFAHGYLGACISGSKTHKRPVVSPCEHRFDARCLVRYYPRRCGGLSPVTMLRDYSKNRRRRGLLPRYRAVVVNSSHLRHEYVRNGCDPARVRAIPLPVGESGTTEPPRVPDPGRWRLVFAGRMDHLKGGLTLLEAMPAVLRELDRPVLLTFAGDGPDRARWERAAAALHAAGPDLEVAFAGWVEPEHLAELWARTDLLVVPSLWPEPFGLVGPEAGRHGVPAAAFSVGGIPDWLVSGENGVLAPGDPPTATGLARAVVNCLRDPRELARLGEGARRLARRFGRDAHLDRLTAVLRAAALESPPAPEFVVHAP